MLPFLGLAMQSRGRDAWGASNGDSVIKRVGELAESWHESREEIEMWTAGIFHTRGASSGSAKKLENAHPFEYARADGDRIIGIHNGCLSNHVELDRKYNRNCDVDSMHLWMHRAEGKEWSDIEGWGNLAWWETDSRGRRLINLARFHSDALHVAQLAQGEIIFCSELPAIRTISKMLGNPIKTTWVLDEYHHYWCAPSAEGAMTLWRSEKRLPFPERYFNAVSVNYGSGFMDNPASRRNPIKPWADLDGLCAKCGISRINSKKDLLCVGCFGEMTTEFLRWKDAEVVGGRVN
jgi:asparagine synthetase B (glutamine-hydrolysing)